MAIRPRVLHGPPISNSLVVRPGGVEPPTSWVESTCSLQLSYGRKCHSRSPTDRSPSAHCRTRIASSTLSTTATSNPRQL